METYLRIKDIMNDQDVSQKKVQNWIASNQLRSQKNNGVYKINYHDYLRFKETYLKSENPEDSNSDEKTKISTVSKSKRDDVNFIDIANVWNNPTKSSLTSVDLFCGAGGITKGFELAGINNICGLDWFKEAGMTYRKNFQHPFVYGDITNSIIKRTFYDTVKHELKGRKLNIIAGGFPCQGFSMSGNRIVNDPRNSLYLEMLEIVKELDPDFVIMENVKGLRSMLNGKVEDKIKKDYEDLGYKVNITILKASDYYVPQKRERIIFVCNKIGLDNFHPKPILTEDKYVTTKQAIQDLFNLPDDKNFNHVRTRHTPEMKERLAKVPEGKSLYSNYSDSWKKCPWNEASCTIKENHGGVNIHPRDGRVITAREMARLQSFPDDFIFEGPKNKQLVQLGNAVPPLLAKAIGLSIRKSYGEI